MDISKAISELKKEPGFADNVGMILVHNGVVRGWSRADHAGVSEITIDADRAKVEQICAEIETRPGIFKVLSKVNTGTFKPGDDVLFLIVAGDIRENVKSALSELLDRVKAEAIHKNESKIS